MRNGGPSPVLGFTEAELGIVLALLAAVAVSARAAPPDPPPALEITADSVQTLEAEIARRAAENARQADSLAAQERRLAAQRDSLDRLKSSIWPNCTPAVPILTVDVVGPDAYRLDGSVVPLSAIDQRTATPRADAERRECRLIVGVRTVSGLAAADYQRALDRVGSLGLRTRSLGEAAP